MRHALFGLLSVVLAVSTPRAALAEDLSARVVAPPTRDPSTPVPAEPQRIMTGCDGCGAGTRSDDPTAERGMSRRTSRWYGWQTLTTDAAAVTLFAGGLAGDSSSVMTAGLVTFGLGAPIVHLAHGRGGAAAGSLAARVASPLVGGLIGYAAQQCPRHSPDDEDRAWCGVGGAAIGFLIGAGIASAFDAGFLAQEDVRAEPPKRAFFSVSPTVGVSKHAGTVGVAGAF